MPTSVNQNKQMSNTIDTQDADFNEEADFFELNDENDVEGQENQTLEFTLSDQDCGQRLDKVLAGLMPEYSRNRIQLWIEEGLVSIDGKPAKAKQTVLGDETLLVQPAQIPEQNAFNPEPIPLDIVYEDDDILVLNKPAGLVVHPAAGNWSGTLLNGLLHYAPCFSHLPRAGIVHRLDKETSGLMVVAKTLAAHTDLVRQLQERSVGREYLALVLGEPRISGHIEAAMARHPRDRIKMAVSQSMHAKEAITHYQRLATGQLDKYPVSLVNCKLETGRTHQIRVHMQHLGFPLIGDAMYGKPHLTKVFPRQALHARKLGLIHPKTGEEMAWEIALPADMAELLARAGITAP